MEAMTRHGAEHDDPVIAAAFLERLLADMEEGTPRTLESYQAMFPGSGDLVAGEFGRLRRSCALIDGGGTADVATAVSREPAPGDSVGPYRVVRELGRGGQGAVYLATDTRLHRSVALKVLAPDRRATLEALQRFHREAEVASRLDHPGICDVYDVGVSEGRSFIAMRFIEGESLARSIAATVTGISAERPSCVALQATTELERSVEDQPSSARDLRARTTRVLVLFDQAARALHAAHEAGVIHRDVKPGNIMVSPEGQPVILDFGLARAIDAEHSLTGSGALFGTPAYLSPEQLQGDARTLDRRTDVWSLGVSLYECLTLQRPFEASTREGLYRAILDREPSDPRQQNSAISRDVVAILQTALEKDQDRRYQSALSLAEDLEAAAAGEPISVRPVSPPGRALRWMRRRPGRAAVLSSLVLALLLAFGLGGFMVARWPDFARGREQQHREEADRLVQDGYLRFMEAHPDSAVAAFDAALSHWPDSPEAVAGLCLSRMRWHDPASALALLDEHADVVERHPELRRLRAEAFLQLDREAEAARLTAELGEPRSSLGFYLEGMRIATRRERLGDRGAPARALPLLRRAIVLSERPSATYIAVAAQNAGAAGDRATAEDMAAALTLRWPRSPLSWHWAGLALWDVDPERALAMFRHGIEMASDRPTIWSSRSSLLWELGRLDEAEESVRRALGLDPGFRHARIGLGLILQDRGELDEAARCYEQILAEDDADGEAHTNLGLVLRQLGREEEAVAHQRRAVALLPCSLIAWNGLGVAQMALGEFDEAADALKRALDIDPRFAATHTNLGIVRLQQGRLEESIEHLERALELDPTLIDVYINLGGVLAANGRLNEAEGRLRAGIEIHSDHPCLWFNLGRVRMAQGDADAARSCIRRAIDLEPDYAEAWEFLGLSLQLEGQFREGLEAIRKAHEVMSQRRTWRYMSVIAGEDSPLVASLEECEHLLERWQRAEQVLEGSSPIADADELDELVHVAEYGSRWLAAARLHEIYIAQAGPRVPAGLRSRAARAALRAVGDAELDATARGIWRGRALGWMSGELAAMGEALDAGRLRERRVARLLGGWCESTDLASVRDDDCVAELPGSERAAWRGFWAKVNDLLAELE